MTKDEVLRFIREVHQSRLDAEAEAAKVERYRAVKLRMERGLVMIPSVPTFDPSKILFNEPPTVLGVDMGVKPSVTLLGYVRDGVIYVTHELRDAEYIELKDVALPAPDKDGK
jgi:hypothetical protein